MGWIFLICATIYLRFNTIFVSFASSILLTQQNAKRFEFMKQMKLLAKTLGAEIIEVNATFELTYPNGDEIREIEKNDLDGLGDFGEFLKRRLAEAIFWEGE